MLGMTTGQELVFVAGALGFCPAGDRLLRRHLPEEESDSEAPPRLLPTHRRGALAFAHGTCNPERAHPQCAAQANSLQPVLPSTLCLLHGPLMLFWQPGSTHRQPATMQKQTEVIVRDKLTHEHVTKYCTPHAYKYVHTMNLQLATM